MSILHPWNSKGLLDPISSPLAMNRAPYVLSPVQLVERFGHTAIRRKILRGFFAYRAGLRELQITEGFQWIDGSFVEEIEVLENRPPADLDVVTFYQLPDGETQKSILAKAPDYFPADEAEKKALKAKFGVDTMMSCLNVSPRQLVKRSAFFYSMWAHRRDYTWKGFIQVDLEAGDDAAAEQKLGELEALNVAAMLEQENEI